LSDFLVCGSVQRQRSCRQNNFGLFNWIEFSGFK